MEKHYAFLKANRVEQVAVFAEQDDDFATRICIEQGFDKFIWLGENTPPHKWATYDSATGVFTEPTNDYLISIGVMQPAVESAPTE